MVIRYANDEVERICNSEQYARQYYPPAVYGRLKNLMVRLAATDKFFIFYQSDILRKKYKCHQLKGKKKGIVSLSIDRSIRMELIVEHEIVDGKDVITILEVSNHYGD